MRKLILSTNGTWSECFNRFSINTSDILTILIKEAAKCNRFSSDLFIDWLILNNNLSNNQYAGQTLLFGFRENGVDHNAFVECRIKSHDLQEYRDIYRLEIKVNFPDITMELYHTYHKPEPYQIPRQRLEEISTKFKDAFFITFDNKVEAFEYIQEDLDLTPEECEWLGVEIPDEYEEDDEWM